MIATGTVKCFSRDRSSNSCCGVGTLSLDWYPLGTSSSPGLLGYKLNSSHSPGHSSNQGGGTLDSTLTFLLTLWLWMCIPRWLRAKLNQLALCLQARKISQLCTIALVFKLWITVWLQPVNGILNDVHLQNIFYKDGLSNAQNQSDPKESFKEVWQHKPFTGCTRLEFRASYENNNSCWQTASNIADPQFTIKCYWNVIFPLLLDVLNMVSSIRTYTNSSQDMDVYVHFPETCLLFMDTSHNWSLIITSTSNLP